MKEEGFFMKTRSTLRSAVLRSTTTIAITAGAMLLPVGLLFNDTAATEKGDELPSPHDGPLARKPFSGSSHSFGSTAFTFSGVAALSRRLQALPPAR